MEKIKDRSHNFILNYSFRFMSCLIAYRVKNNSLANVNSLNNILWNIEISYNKQNIFYCISQLACYIRIIKMFFVFCNQMSFRSDKTHNMTRCKQALTLFPLPPSKSTDRIVKCHKTESLFHAALPEICFLTEITGVVNCAKKKKYLSSDKHMLLA